MIAFSTLLLLLPLTLASPLSSLAARQSDDFAALAQTIPATCPANNVRIPLPTNFTLSANETTHLVTVGRGTQNYTCTNGTFVSAGAVADLYDVTCVFAASSHLVSAASVSELLPKLALSGIEYPDESGLPVAIKHFFTATATGISPVFATDSDQVVLKRDSGVDAVNPTTNVPYLKLVAVEGTLAQTVFRLDTAGGQPPSSCTTEGQSTTVPYAAMYYFTK